MLSVLGDQLRLIRFGLRLSELCASSHLPTVLEKQLDQVERVVVQQDDKFVLAVALLLSSKGQRCATCRRLEPGSSGRAGRGGSGPRLLRECVEHVPSHLLRDERVIEVFR